MTRRQTWKRPLGAFLAGLLVTCGIAATQQASAADAPAWCTDKSDVSIFGTSAETGYGTTGYVSATDTYARTTFGWATKFADNLNATWATQTHNYSHNGALASDYLPGGRWTSTTGAIANAGAYSPSIALVDLGGNDYYSQNSPTNFAANLAAVIDAIRAQRADTVILLSIYPEIDRSSAVSTYGPTTHTWSEYASAIYNTAVSKGTALIDMRQYVPSATAAVQTNPSVWNSDKIHLNDAGNAAEFGAWFGWTSSIWSICG